MFQKHNITAIDKKSKRTLYEYQTGEKYAGIVWTSIEEFFQSIRHSWHTSCDLCVAYYRSNENYYSYNWKE